MTKDFLRQHDDEQLIFGLPKHMMASSSTLYPSTNSTGRGYEKQNASNGQSISSGGVYWTVHPGPDACDRCKALAGIEFREEPERPHPNCRCKIIKHADPVNITGQLEGHESYSTIDFYADQKIYVTIRCAGLFGGGVHITVDDNVTRSTGKMCLGDSISFEFTKFGELPVPWRVSFLCVGDDTALMQYQITG